MTVAAKIVRRQTFLGPRRWKTPATELSALFVGVVCSLPAFALGHDLVAVVLALTGFALALRLHPGRRESSVTVGADGFDQNGTFFSWAKVKRVELANLEVIVETDEGRRVLRAHDPSGLRHAIEEAHARYAAPVRQSHTGDYRTAEKSKDILVRVVTSATDLVEREAAFAQLDADTREEILSAMADSRTREHLQS